MPLYRGLINKELHMQEQMTKDGGLNKPKYEIFIKGERVKVLKAKIGDVRCYFIDIPTLFSNGSIYKDLKTDLHGELKRWAQFQKAAADLAYLFNKKTKKHPGSIVHVHDSQTALVPKFLKHQHIDEWKKGETPATVFTFHNNLCHTAYEGKDEKSVAILKELGLPRQGANSFIEGLKDSEVVTTVSKKFGMEAQDPNFKITEHEWNDPVLKAGLHTHVKQAAWEGKLVGVPNGNNLENWDCSTDPVLKKWVSICPETMGRTLDLTFNPNLTNQEMAEKIIAIRREFCAVLKSFPKENVGIDSPYVELDPTKPILTILNRFDHFQKGTNFYEAAMDEVLAQGGQILVVGTNPTEEARAVLSRMQQRANALGNKGVLVLIDKKVEGGLYFQQVLKLGPMIRAMTDYLVALSVFEPFGLMPKEFAGFWGKKAIASQTGGFADTLNAKNAYLLRTPPQLVLRRTRKGHQSSTENGYCRSTKKPRCSLLK